MTVAATGRAGPAFRPIELSLLVLPALFIVGGTLVVLASAGRPFGTPALLPALLFVGIALAIHVALSIAGFRGDQFVFPLAVALTGVGLVMVARLDPVDLAPRQTIWALLGLAAFLATVLIVREPPTLRRYKYTAAILGLAFIAMTLVLGKDLNGSGVRLSLSFGPVQFQPSEIVKILLVIFFAGYLEEYAELLAVDNYRLGPLTLPPLPYLIPLVGMWLLSILLFIAQPELGTAMLFFAVFLAMLFAASGRLVYVGASFAAFAVGAALCYRLLPFVHRLAERRVSIWLDPWSQSSDAGYQIVQALVALASGGVLGAGLGTGQPGYIPAVATDFVFSAIGEEFGLAGTLAIVLCYVLLVHRGFRIALRATNPFNQLLAVGLTAVLGFQTLVILGGNLRLIPLTGITLPFMSYGGSSLLTNFVLAGLLMAISRPATRR